MSSEKAAALDPYGAQIVARLGVRPIVSVRSQRAIGGAPPVRGTWR